MATFYKVVDQSTLNIGQLCCCYVMLSKYHKIQKVMTSSLLLGSKKMLYKVGATELCFGNKRRKFYKQLLKNDENFTGTFCFNRHNI